MIVREAYLFKAGEIILQARSEAQSRRDLVASTRPPFLALRNQVASNVWSGAEALDGRAPAWPAFAALVLGYAFHLIGALALPASLYLVFQGLNRRERRQEMLVMLAATFVLVGVIAWAARGLYAGSSPFTALANGVVKVLFQPRDMQVASVFTFRRLADVWSHIVQMGPLSFVTTVLLATLPRAA